MGRHHVWYDGMEDTACNARNRGTREEGGRSGSHGVPQSLQSQQRSRDCSRDERCACFHRIRAEEAGGEREAGSARGTPFCIESASHMRTRGGEEERESIHINVTRAFCSRRRPRIKNLRNQNLRCAKESICSFSMGSWLVVLSMLILLLGARGCGGAEVHDAVADSTSAPSAEDRWRLQQLQRVTGNNHCLLIHI